MENKPILNSMKSLKRKSIKKTAAKLLFAGVLSFGLMGFTSATFAQVPPTPPGGPPLRANC
ncbi:hypothetical protein [Mucilaginibacter antarcticus]|uniref:hypothetical protein n=1 Tax=Mucilaginibacter antarcticus TaxID=1855725 RepID=UPI00363972C2